ncbi:MAG: metallophosphoesterase [Kiritimatiellae bacterium]|nr:metallophosphoesterase [Kiritimatiellia bacterium]
MDFNRREVLKGGLSALGLMALPGVRVFAAPVGWKPHKKPNLVFGILSDTHLQSGWDGVKPHGGFPLTYVTNAMKLFRERDIDAFMHLGDAAHRGKNVEVKYHRDIFEKFFPRGKARDGRTVEKLLVVGNHELFGNEKGGPGAWGPNVWPDPAERAKHVLCADLPRYWEQTWGEKYEEVWHKEVKGYHFFGRHWETDEMKLAEFIQSKAEECSLKGTKPFFILSHQRNHFKCNHALREFPNAVAFFGHWHQSNADCKTIYYDSFGGFFPSIQVGACRMDGCNVLDGNEKVLADMRKDAMKEQNGCSNKVESRQAMIVNVYDDVVVFERHEVGQGGKLGPDWVMPLGEYNPHPFSREGLVNAIGAPKFGKNAKLDVKVMAGKKMKPGVKAAPNAASRQLRVTIPLADGNPDSRVFAYEMEIVGDDAEKKCLRSAYFEGCNLGMGQEPNKGVTVVDMPVSELPEGKKLAIAIRPLSSLGTKGDPLVVTYIASSGAVKAGKAGA